MCHPSVAKEYRMMVEHMHSTSKNDEFKSQCVELIDNINKIESEGLRKEDVAIGSSITKVCVFEFFFCIFPRKNREFYIKILDCGITYFSIL